MRKIMGYVLMSALLICGVGALALGIEIWLTESGRVGPVMMIAGGAIAALAGYTLAEDFAERFLKPTPRVQQPDKAAQAPALPPPDCS